MTANRIHLRPGRTTRPIAAALATVLLALSVAAGFHQGDHDDLGWLPSRFHHHDYRVRAEGNGPPRPLVDHCLACHVTRTMVRFTPPAPPLPAVAAATGTPIPASAGAATARADFPRTPRAPPA